jgi:hypothetical protein
MVRADPKSVGPSGNLKVRSGSIGDICPVQSMSALTPKADIVRHGGNVHFVPKADIPRCRPRPGLRADLKCKLGQSRLACLRSLRLDNWRVRFRRRAWRLQDAARWWRTYTRRCCCSSTCSCYAVFPIGCLSAPGNSPATRVACRANCLVARVILLVDRVRNIVFDCTARFPCPGFVRVCRSHEKDDYQTTQ